MRASCQLDRGSPPCHYVQLTSPGVDAAVHWLRAAAAMGLDPGPEDDRSSYTWAAWLEGTYAKWVKPLLDPAELNEPSESSSDGGGRRLRRRRRR